MADDPFDVGVLVVHGIGTQSQGSSLREFVDPVVDLLGRLGPSPHGEVDLLPEPAKGMVGIHTPPLGNAERQKWLVAEAWWADAFDAPDRGEVTKWLVGVGPWFVLFFVARLWRRFHVDWLDAFLGVVVAGLVVELIRAAAVSTVNWQWGAVGIAILLMIAKGAFAGHRAAGTIVVVSLLIIYPLAALETVAMMAIWLVGLLPGKWSASVRAFQVSLSGSVGDAYALISSPRRERAMFDAITEALRQLTAVLDHGARQPVVVVAHSQGAALLYRMLKREDAAFRKLLTYRDITLATHGAAIMPIHVLEHRRRTRSTWGAWASAAAGFFGLLLLAVTLGHVAAGEVDLTTAVTGVGSVLLVGGAFLVVRGDEDRSHCHDPLQILPGADGPESGERKQDSDQPPPERETKPLRGGEAPRDRVVSAAHTGLVGPAVEPSPRGAGDETDPMEPERVCAAVPIPPGAELRWVDLWAPWDPVPNGPLDLDYPHAGETGYEPLPGTAGSGFLPCRVANDHQPWRDHVVYRTNDEDVVTRWIGEISFRATKEQGATKRTEPKDVEPFVDEDPDATRDKRKMRMAIGVQLLAMQGIVAAVGIAAVLARWNEVDDLGRRAQRDLPSPLRTVVATAIDVVPSPVRDVFLGSGRDPARWQGLGASLVAIAVGVFIVTVPVAAWRKANSASLTTSEKPSLATRVMQGVSYAVFILVIAGALCIAHQKGHDGTSRVVTAEIELKNGDRISGVVTFQPVDRGKDESTSVHVGSTGNATAHLDPAVDYVVTATSDRGKDCTAKLDRDQVTVTVKCAEVGPVLRSSK